MGDHMTSCGISRIVIREGDKCVAIPLKKSKYYGENINIFTIHQINFPNHLPIFGEYTGYSDLRNIEVSKYWNQGVDILNINIYEDGITKIPCDYFMFIHRKIWDMIIDDVPYFDDLNRKLDPYLDLDVTSFILEKVLNFEFVENYNLDERYNLLYKHNSSNKYGVLSDGNFIEIVNLNNNEILDLEYKYIDGKYVSRNCILGLVSIWKDLTGQTINYNKLFNIFSILTAQFLHNYIETNGKLDYLENKLATITENEEKLIFIKTEFIEFSELRDKISQIFSWWIPRFNFKDRELVEQFDLFTLESQIELRDLRCFLATCKSNNILLQPSFGYSQYGQPYGVLELNKKILKFSQKYVEKVNKEYDEN